MSGFWYFDANRGASFWKIRTQFWNPRRWFIFFEARPNVTFFAIGLHSFNTSPRGVQHRLSMKLQRNTEARFFPTDAIQIDCGWAPQLHNHPPWDPRLPPSEIWRNTEAQYPLSNNILASAEPSPKIWSETKTAKPSPSESPEKALSHPSTEKLKFHFSLIAFCR